ncbi:MAG TPA: hypothetical protein VFO89_08070 [Thermoanaerobaculia bacterium]|nr:hypothetical protein [Thermoanaerobaculia bacterium]
MGQETSVLPTPISVLETYFQRRLVAEDMPFWKGVPDDTWVDFAKSYLAAMKAGFTPQAMAERNADTKVRLYFDFRFSEDYDREIVRRYRKTPLLSHSPYPAENVDYTGDGLSDVLAPLRKHLLVADELYVQDNFYRCFDFVADSYPRHGWQANPNVESGVHRSVAAILQWLPILAGLRELIVSGVVNFVPYYVIPSFPYHGGNPFMEQHIALLDIPPDPRVTSAEPVIGFDLSLWSNPPAIPAGPWVPPLDCESALYAWVNARLLGLDPVFADKKTWQWASGIKFRNETKADLTTDLMSIDILPLGERGNLSVQDIMSMREGEEVFRHIRETLAGCKDYLQVNASPDASTEFLTTNCRQYIRDHLDGAERLKWIKFLDNDLVAGTVVSLAMGAAFMTANPWIGLFVRGIRESSGSHTLRQPMEKRKRPPARATAFPAFPQALPLRRAGKIDG